MNETSTVVDLLERVTGEKAITPDSEEGGVITLDFTSPVKGATVLGVYPQQ